VIRGELYRVKDKEPLRGNKPGYYVVVSRNFVATSELVSTVICAPVYSEYLGLETEVAIDESDGVAHPSSVRCDFLMLMSKERLQHLVGRLSGARMKALDRALRIALSLS
jgi:mRNA-degrading endonuclease toxin of MazEF toxin-antitoxin module